MFKVGDKVIVHKYVHDPEGIPWVPPMDDLIGLHGVITHKFDNGGCKIKFDKEAELTVSRYDWTFPEGSLIHVDKPEGMKFNSGKVRMSLMTRTLIKPLYAIASVLTYGAMKYLPNNWQGVDPESYEDALDRHLAEWRAGEAVDSDTGLHHLAHAGCNVLFLLWFEIKDMSLSEISTFKDPTDQYKEQREQALKERGDECDYDGYHL